MDEKRHYVVFGVPAFQVGWEMNAFANNIETIKIIPEYEILFCGADNPRAVYEILEELLEGKKTNSFYVAPLGTKPHAIGVAIFCSKNPDVGILYDHPMRQEGRSSNLGACHLYSVSETLDKS